MKILKNRTVLGLICIVLALIICFGITPMFNSAMKAQADIVRVKADIAKGDYITDTMVEVVTVGANNLPANLIRSKDSVVGKYAAADMFIGDYFLSGKLSDMPLTNDPYLLDLDGSKVAVSVTIPTFASGLSAKLQAGDIITLISTNNDTKTTVIRDELRYVKVLAVTMPSGADMTYQQAREKSEDDKDELPTTLTLLVNIEQARVIAELEASSRIHAALVYRGTKVNADKFLAAQDEYFTALEEEAEKEQQEGPQKSVTPDPFENGREDDADAE